jgi:hypothetical protein
MDKMAPYMSAPAPTSIAPRPVRRCSSLGATKIVFFAGSLSQVLHNLNVDGRVKVWIPGVNVTFSRRP